jgi:hypothetical protein
MTCVLLERMEIMIKKSGFGSGIPIGKLLGYRAVPAGTVVKACHQVGLVSDHVPLTVTLEPGTLHGTLYP